MMLHAGANPVDYDALRTLPVPDATATHVPIPHFRVVDLVAHSLGYYGHQVTEQHSGVTPDGARFFGVLCLKSEYTGYTDMVKQWDEPTHDWGGKTAYRLFNAGTFVLTGKVAEKPDLSSKLHDLIDNICV